MGDLRVSSVDSEECGARPRRPRQRENLLRRVLASAGTNGADPVDTVAAIAVDIRLAGHRPAAVVGCGRGGDRAAGVFRTRESVTARRVLAPALVRARRAHFAPGSGRTCIARIARDQFTAEDVRAGRAQVAARSGRTRVSTVAGDRLTATLVCLRRGR